jgi:hypothetical protein
VVNVAGLGNELVGDDRCWPYPDQKDREQAIGAPLDIRGPAGGTRQQSGASLLATRGDVAFIDKEA